MTPTPEERMCPTLKGAHLPNRIGHVSFLLPSPQVCRFPLNEHEAFIIIYIFTDCKIPGI